MRAHSAGVPLLGHLSRPPLFLEIVCPSSVRFPLRYKHHRVSLETADNSVRWHEFAQDASLCPPADAQRSAPLAGSRNSADSLGGKLLAGIPINTGSASRITMKSPHTATLGNG